MSSALQNMQENVSPQKVKTTRFTPGCKNKLLSITRLQVGDTSIW